MNKTNITTNNNISNVDNDKVEDNKNGLYANDKHTYPSCETSL